MEAAVQTRIAGSLRKQMAGRCLISISDNITLCNGFATVAVMRDGQVVEHGPTERLARPGSALADMGFSLPVTAAAS
jgi:ABC-type dipeptide/oligopeptide/nickel transport system ATPase component